MTEPVISVLKGCLGNCMFQIAAGLTYANSLGRPYRVYYDDARQYNPQFEFILERYERVDELPKNGMEWREPDDQEYVPIKEMICDCPLVLYGYFQDERYFKKNEVLKWFEAPPGYEFGIYEKYGDLSDFVSISVRRGDYVDLGIETPEIWYENAYHTFFEGRRAFITSDDMDWCKRNLKIPNAIYSEGGIPMEDLYGCAICKDHITYNGSFGWWGAYLGEIDGSIIVAKNIWHDEIENKSKTVPDRWIKF